MSQHTFS